MLALNHDKKVNPVDTGRKLNVHKMFRRRPGRPEPLVYVQFTSCFYRKIFFQIVLGPLHYHMQFQMHKQIIWK